MFTYAQWKESKTFQQEFAAFIRTDCGQAFKQVLIDMMLDSWPELSREADVISVEAMSSSTLKGYRQCYRNLDKLMPEVIENENRPPEKVEFSPSGLPVNTALLEQVKAKHLPKKPTK